MLQIITRLKTFYFINLYSLMALKDYYPGFKLRMNFHNLHFQKLRKNSIGNKRGQIKINQNKYFVLDK